MSVERVAGPITLFTGTSGGSPRTYRFTPTPGGEGVGQLQYQVHVVDVKNTAIVAIELRLEHGVDGSVSVAHSTPIASTTISAAPTLVVGDAGTDMLGPWTHLVVELDRTAGTGEQWIVVEIYEIRKGLV